MILTFVFIWLIFAGRYRYYAMHKIDYWLLAPYSNWSARTDKAFLMFPIAPYDLSYFLANKRLIRLFPSIRLAEYP